MLKKENNPFKTNPFKADAKIQTNNNLMGVCLTIFGIMWAFSSDDIDYKIVLQFVFAIPLLFVSSLAYTKIAYWKEVKVWDYFGWFTSTTAIAFVLNVIGILTFLLGYPGLAIAYFLITWLLLSIYTFINYKYNKRSLDVKLFKLFYFIIIQLFFGVLVLYI